MNISSSEYYSSGCESGWTMYLDQTSNSNYHELSTREEEDIFLKNSCEGKKGCLVGATEIEEEEEEDEDLSMVSDASSGPPHFQTDTHFYAYASSVSLPKENKNKHKSKPTVHSFSIDDTDNDTDTATSPIFNFTQINNVAPSGFSQVFSDANIEGKSITKKHLGFFKSSTKGKSSSLLGRKRQ